MIKKILGVATASILFLGYSSTAFAGFSYAYGTPANPQKVSIDSEVFTSLASCDAAKARFEEANPTIYAGPCSAVSLQQVSGVIPTGSNPASGIIPTAAPNTSAPTTPIAFANPINANTFSDFVAQITKSAVEILMPFVVLAFIWSGFLFVRAQGKEEELVEAKKAIWWSVIGAFILMGAWGFAQIISDTMSTITTP